MTSMFFDENGADALRHYKYSGGDISYVYLYVLTPMNNFLEKFIPRWIAPNVMTITGLFIVVQASFLMFFAAPNFYEYAPPWVYLYVAASFFVYQTIDNLDGRQARRTSSSSPLGLLLDHGCDALTVTVGNFALSTGFQLGDENGATLKVLLLWTVGFFPFAFAAWDEYFTNTLVLGRINGPTDGMLLAMIFTAMMAFIPNLWSTPIGKFFPLLADTPLSFLLTWKMHWFILFFIVNASWMTVATNIYEVSCKKNLFDGPAKKILPFLYQICLMWIWALTPLKSLSGRSVFLAHPRLFLWGFGFIFGENVCTMMLAHVCNKDYPIIRRNLFPVTFIAAVSTFAPVLLGVEPLLTPHAAMLLHLVIAAGWWLYFVVKVVRKICVILNIHPFRIHSKHANTSHSNGHTNGNAKKAD